MPLHPLRGHEALRSALARARSAGTLPSALLLHGARGVGKQRLALWIGQLALCEAPGPDGPCGACLPCRQALRVEHPDLHWYVPLPKPPRVSPSKLAEAFEDGRRAMLEEVREDPVRSSHRGDGAAYSIVVARALRRRAQSGPNGPTQIFVVAEAELLVPQEASPEAANALLKLLEEPPRDTHFVLTSSEPGRLLPTIRSRTVPLHVPRLERGAVADFLVEVAGREPGEAERAAALAGGSIGRALGFLPAGDGAGPLEELRGQALELLRAGLAPDPGGAFEAGLAVKPVGARGYVELLGLLDEWLRDLAAVASGVPERAVHGDRVDWLERQIRERGIRADDAARSLEVVEEARRQARGNVNPQLLVAGLVGALRRRLVRGR